MKLKNCIYALMAICTFTVLQGPLFAEKEARKRHHSSSASSRGSCCKKAKRPASQCAKTLRFLRSPQKKNVKNSSCEPQGIRLGIDRIFQEPKKYRELLQNKSVAVIMHGAMSNSESQSELNTLIDQLPEVYGSNVSAIITAEGGVTTKEGLFNILTTYRGIPITNGFSLLSSFNLENVYPEDLGTEVLSVMNSVDAIIYDYTSIDMRFYTYDATMANLMAYAARAQKPFIVLDRPNATGGCLIQGPIRNYELINEFTVNWYGISEGLEVLASLPIPIMHGMTQGELALFLNNDFIPNYLNGEQNQANKKTDLHIIKVSGWKRNQTISQTTVPVNIWSPSLQFVQGPLFYSLTGLTEALQGFCSMRLDRFEAFGNPSFNEEQAKVQVERLNAQNLPGLKFTVYPFSSTDRNVSSGTFPWGFRIEVYDEKAVDHLLTSIAILQELISTPGVTYDPDGLDELWGGLPRLSTMIESLSARQIVASVRSQEELFRKQRKPFLLY